MTGRWRVFVVLVGCVAVLWAATGLDARLPRAAAAGPAPDASSTPAPSLAAAPVLYFVHLGDIWRFDAQAGAVSVFQGAGGACVGHVSWSADGRTVAWETRVWTEGQARSSVMVRRLPLTPSGPELLRTFADAASPAVSPDGLHLLYQAADAGRSSLMCVDLESDAAVTVMQGARNGAWVSVAEAPGEARLQVAFDLPGEEPSQRGFWLMDFPDGDATLRPVGGDDTADVQRGRWAPVADPRGAELLVTRFDTDGRRAVVRVGDGATLLDVSNADHFDYRWLQRGEGGALPCVELAPMAVGRSDIHVVQPDPAGGLGIGAGGTTGAAAGAVTDLLLLDSSFGWNASLPARSPFSDLAPGQDFYEAAAALWTQKVVSGFPDGSFRAGETVKRAQLAKMLAGATGMEVYGGLPSPPFSDVGENVAALYPREYLSAAHAVGLVQGYRDGRFRPWAAVSRAQVVSMVVRAARRYLSQGPSDTPRGWSGLTSGYQDPDHGGNVHVAEYNGLLAGLALDGWDPGGPALRGEVAQMLLNLQRLRGPLALPHDPPAYALGTRSLGLEVQAPPRVVAPIGNIVFDGDSLTAGSTASDPYPSQVMRAFRPEVPWVNLGIGGQTIATMLVNAPDKVDPLFQVGLGRNVVFIWGGTNDLRWWSHTPRVIYERLRSYCLGRRAQGFTVVTLTMLPRTDGVCPPSFETQRQQFNAMLRVGWAGFADVLIDVGADPFLGRPGCEADARFFSGDLVHLNNNGLALVAGRARMLLERVDALARD